MSNPGPDTNTREAECGCRWDLSMKKMLDICPGHKALLRLDHMSPVGDGQERDLTIVVTDLAAPVPTPAAENGWTIGQRLISQERRRQIEVEGYNREHDVTHGSPTLIRAARCYEVPRNMPGVPDAWPWEPSAWKPRDLLSNLIRAGALYWAAMDAAPPLGQDLERAREGRDRCVGAIDGFIAALAHLPAPIPAAPTGEPADPLRCPCGHWAWSEHSGASR